MNEFILNLLLVQLVPFIYAFFCMVDYMKNKEAYHNYPGIKDKTKLVAKNIFLYMPIIHTLIFTLFPHQVIFKTGFKEVFFLVFEIIFMDIYFHTTHRMCHQNKFLYKNVHKIHHEIEDTLGMFAFYCHPFEMIVVNMGNIYLTHMVFNHSYFHNAVFTIIGFGNTILFAHKNNNREGHHQIHHSERNVNFGLDLFMDRLMDTEQMPE